MNKGNAEDYTPTTHRSAWRARRIGERTRNGLGRTDAGGNGTWVYRGVRWKIKMNRRSSSRPHRRS